MFLKDLPLVTMNEGWVGVCWLGTEISTPKNGCRVDFHEFRHPTKRTQKKNRKNTAAKSRRGGACKFEKMMVSG